jgi:hypothetical protein
VTTCSPSFEREYHAVLRRMLARGQTRLSANCLAAELWPDARHNNAHGQSFNLAAGVAGRILRKYRGCYEVQHRVWEIVPDFISENAKAHAPRSAGAGDGLGVGVMAWGGHENWAADRGCHAATCSWKEIPRKHGFIHGRSSPNPTPAQVTKPAPRRIGGTQAHKLLLMGCGDSHRKSCHLHWRLSSLRDHAIHVRHVMSPPETHQARTAKASH